MNPTATETVLSSSCSSLALTPCTSQQLVILVGGKGTRLGSLSQSTPKPLMQIDERQVFLDFLLDGALRQGFRHVLMIAGHLGEQVAERYAHRRIWGADIDVLIEPEPMGTAGALAFAKQALADRFILMNGDTIFDTNIRAVDALLSSTPDAACSISLREIDDVSRYGAVDVDNDGHVVRFQEKNPNTAQKNGVINAGIYALRRSVLDLIPDRPTSLEQDVLPVLADRRQIVGIASSGYFLDIGLPETLQQAQKDLPSRTRPVIFFDRDGVLNIDHGYTHSLDQWEWVPGAMAAIKAANDAGIAVVVVTNQAGVARGYYGEPDIWRLHHHIQQQLNLHGAFIDQFYYCPDHPDAVVDSYRAPAPLGRKPSPAMLSRAIRQLRLNREKAIFVGDQQSDMDAAAALGIPGLYFKGGQLDDFLFNSPAWASLIS